MKNIFKKLGFAGIATLAGASVALAATPSGGLDTSGLCGIITQMYDVFKILRTLAFVGAAFIIAGWAWGYIKDGGGKDGMIEDLKKKGTGMLVGFVLLFGIGVVLQFFVFSKSGLDLMGCENIITGWGAM